jgi:hypothetical protein
MLSTIRLPGHRPGRFVGEPYSKGALAPEWPHSFVVAAEAVVRNL